MPRRRFVECASPRPEPGSQERAEPVPKGRAAKRSALDAGLRVWHLLGSAAFGGRGTAGSTGGPVALALEEQMVARVDDPVQDRLADDGVGEQGIPVNWKWHTFL